MIGEIPQEISEDGAAEEDPTGSAQQAIVKSATKEKGEGGSSEQRVGAAEGVLRDDEVIIAMKKELDAEEGAEDEGSGAEEDKTTTGAQEKYGDGPDEIELLLDGERPEVGERKHGGPVIVAHALGYQRGVLKIEGEGEELVMEV